MIQVASYCRVSTDKDDQANSFEAQQRYFKEYIDRRPDWELYEVYADEGITGTSTKKRTAFNRMIHDAHLGKFKLILTKEVSRFSRNILDTISYTRELKQLGVGVLFMNDGISTLEPDAELRLSIMGSIAQEESRKTSSRVKWGQTRQMERGVVFGTSLLGYDVKDGQITINPEGAELVRLIFHKYGVEKKGTSVIARELREAGYRTRRGNAKWSNSYIIKVLRNEKYVGDLVQKKTYTPDYLTHQKKRNTGQEELVVLENHHEPIIDRALWNLVQSELNKRNIHGKYSYGHSNRYVFSGKIKCGVCGASFVSRQKKRQNGPPVRRWGCYNATVYGRQHMDTQGNKVGCNIGTQLRDEIALEMVKQALSSLRMDRDWIIRNVTEIAMDAIQSCEQGSTESAERLEFEMNQLTRKKENVLDAFFSHSITKGEMRLMNERYDRELEALQKRLNAVQAKKRVDYDTAMFREDIKRHVSDILNQGTSGDVFYRNLLDHLTVYPDKRVEVQLNLLPHKWIYVIDRLQTINRQLQGEQAAKTPKPDCNNDNSVPISVSTPFSSS